MLTLDELAIKHRADKSSVGHEYADIYDLYLQSFRDKPLHFLEIGVKRGSSVSMWSEYFTHPHAKLSALDIDYSLLRRNLRCLLDQNDKESKDPRWKLFEGDQSDPSVLSRIIERDSFDVIVDDGSHRGIDQKASMECLWPYVKKGGYYIIEDLQTAYVRTDEYNGNVDIVSYLRKHYVDELLKIKKKEPKPFSFIHFYPRTVILKK
jgi:cephalosporin hydroxylase